MNHLVIGLGGTGGKVIRAFRRQIYSEFRSEVPAGVNLQFLYVDSSEEMMGAGDPSWKVLGTSLQLQPAAQLKIGAQDLGSRLANIDNYPGIKPWIGDKAVWHDILGSIVGAALGGQKRRLGRFLFACQAEQFRVRVQSLVKEVQRDGSTAVTFHVVAGLAGGTGSGSIVDAIAQLRALYDDPSRFRIVPYMLLPEQFPSPNWDTGNYHANGYAALAEINAMAVGALEPWDITGQRGRLSLKDPFTGAYLFGNENENGYQADVEAELPGIAADFLFQKIVVADKVGWRSLERMENAENGDGTAELSSTGKRAERSKRFLAFGIKRISIPEEEISEFLTFSFAKQTIQQLRFNNWQDGAGYVDQPRNVDLAAFVRQADVQGRWQLGNDYLTLSVAILPTDDPAKRWKPISEEWSAVMAPFKSVIRALERATWLDELDKLVEKRFAEDYRGSGVAEFYRTKLKAKHDMAREIRMLVERELFSDWRTGVRSLTEVGRTVDALVEDLTERLARCDEQGERQRRAADELGTELQKTRLKWSQIGFLSKTLFGKPDQLLDEYAVYLADHRTALTRAVAWGFAKQLIAEIIAELGDLKATADALLAELRDTLTRVQAHIDERVKDRATDDYRGHLVRFYEPEIVRATVRKLSLDETIQRTQTTTFRQSVADRLGDFQTFDAFRQRMGGAELADLIAVNAETSAIQAHQNVMAGTKERILGVSIVEKLKERYGGDRQALNVFVADLVRQAGSYLRLNPLEVSKAAPGIPTGVQTLVAKSIIILPKTPQHGEFVETLKQAFRQAQPGDLEFIDSDDRANEITMMSIRNLFPARYAAIAALLQERYRQRIAQNPRRFSLELHTEGDGSQLPNLFVTTTDEARRSAIPALLLADAIGLITEVEKGARTDLLLVTRDADGFENDPISLGSDWLDAPASLDALATAELQESVSAALSGVGGDRGAWEASVKKRVDAVRVLAGADPQEARYRAFVEGAKEALRQLRGA